MQTNYKDIVYEFANAASSFESVRNIIIFGSVARDEADKKSDVDILIVFDTFGKKFPEQKRIFSISQDIGHKHDKTLQLIFTNKRFDGLDRKFVETVLKEGITIYGQPNIVTPKRLLLEPYTLLEFSSTDKTVSAKLGKSLFGYRTTKKDKSKTYKSYSEGLVNTYLGKKLGPSAILVPFKSVKIFIGLFSSLRINHKRTDIWIPSIFGKT